MRPGNYTLAPDEIVPSAILFGQFPTVRTILGPRVPRPRLTERARISQRARKLITQELAAAKIKRSIKHKAPSGTDHVSSPRENF